MKYNELALLKSVSSPSDLKLLSIDELYHIADEIRSLMITTASVNGGHLASNLGVVELTIALHLCFDCPKDKLVFDVGHQSYVHKLLTGRAECFHTLRTQHGISGFPKRSESIYDSFNTGHSSTSVSAAIGMLRAMRMQGNDAYVAAVLGDGALTGGLAYEALDDAGGNELPLIVVLNDNGMSIAENVGSMRFHLSKLRTSKGYTRFKKLFSITLRKIPFIGSSLNKRIERLKNRIKYFILPNVLFEEMGFIYLGPVDGHDILQLTKILNHAKKVKKPAIVHVITHKGKGYPPAEISPEKFHGIGQFDIVTGIGSSNKSNTAVFASCLTELAAKDKRIVAITAAMASGTGLNLFKEKFPERFIDVGIAEQHAVTMAAGMACEGMVPVFAVYSTFLQRGYDQLLHDVCLQNLPVVFAIDRAGLVGADGETHQGVYDIAYLMTMPSCLMLFSPSSCEELCAMLQLAVNSGRPCAIRYSRQLLPTRSINRSYRLDEWEVIEPAKKVTVIATGRLLSSAVNACKGLECGIINARILRPVSDSELDKLTGAQAIITIEDGVASSGFGAQLARAVAQKGYFATVIQLGVPDYPIQAASIVEQDIECGLDVSSIRKTVVDCIMRLEAQSD